MLMNRSTNKLLCWYNGISGNINEFQILYIDQKKPDTKKYMLYGLMYIVQEQAKLIYDDRNQNHKGKIIVTVRWRILTKFTVVIIFQYRTMSNYVIHLKLKC